MKPFELALKYMEIFFNGENLDDLFQPFSENFSFEGPLFKFYSAKDYVNSLKLDPPKNFDYKIIRSFENESSTCLIYQFIKPVISVPMAQLFEANGRKNQ